MAESNDPNLVDYLTLGVAAAGLLGTIGTTVWMARRGERDRFDLHIEWAFELNDEDLEWPVLHVHNKSTSKLLISEIRYVVGAFRAKPVFGTALYWEDPSDLDFPATIEAGQIRRFHLSEEGAKSSFAKASKTAKRLGRFRRSAFWIEARSVGGQVRRIGAEPALAWSDRPSWCKLEDENRNA